MTVRRFLLCCSCAVLIVGTTSWPTGALTPKTRAEIVRRTVMLMPPSLARQMNKHSVALYRGALSTSREGEGRGAHAHRPGTAAVRLQRQVERLIALVEQQAPMSEVVQTLGQIAHCTTDLSFALNVGPDHPREEEIYADFSRYIESMLPEMRLVFSSFVDPQLAKGDLARFADDIAVRARRDYDGILSSYFPTGRQSQAEDFDVRSVAFAAASLEVSLAMTATARAWLFAWQQAHGDLQGAIYVGSAGPADPFSPAAVDASNTNSGDEVDDENTR